MLNEREIIPPLSAVYYSIVRIPCLIDAVVHPPPFSSFYFVQKGRGNRCRRTSRRDRWDQLHGAPEGDRRLDRHDRGVCPFLGRPLLAGCLRSVRVRHDQRCRLDRNNYKSNQFCGAPRSSQLRAPLPFSRHGARRCTTGVIAFCFQLTYECGRQTKPFPFVAGFTRSTSA